MESEWMGIMKLKDWSSTELKRDFDKEFEELM